MINKEQQESNIVQSERRYAERFTVSLHGTSKTTIGRISRVEITNISSSGLQFNVDQIEMLTLLPNVTQENTLEPVSIELLIELPDADGCLDETETIKIQCGIVYVRRISLKRCAVGCRFEHFYSDSSKLLSRYISSLDD